MTISDDEVADLQKRRKAILSQTFPEGSSEPICEAEDIGCDCTEAGVESEWDWSVEQQVYVCNGCGQVQ